MNKFEKLINLLDDYNKQDPNIFTWQGVSYPSQYFYALQLYNWVIKLEPHPSEHLLIASRGQHIGRWQIPRENYPMNKPGYLTWRSELAKFHAKIVGDLMKESGYDEETIQAVQHIILKQNIKTDHEVQVMENALCLVFLQFQYEDFLEKHDEEKVKRIIQKSWKKMSDPGRAQALELNYSAKGEQLIKKALA